MPDINQTTHTAHNNSVGFLQPFLFFNLKKGVLPPLFPKAD
jgi:hypothetical protein